MGFIVFGLIFLVVTLIAKKHMKTEATNSNCSEDVKDVKDNHRNYKICLGVSIAMIIVGLILEMIKL